MTGEIRRHRVTRTLEEILTMRSGFLDERIKKLGSNNFSTVYDSALSLARQRCTGDPEAEMLETWESFVTSMQVGSALFSSVMSPDGDLERMIAHEMRPVEVSAPQYYSSAGNWLDAFWLAVICREGERMTELCQVPVDLLRQSAPDAYDAYIYSWVDALQGYWLRRDDVAEKVMAAMELTEPDQLREGSREIVMHLMYPTIPVFIRFLQRDNEGFNKILADALKWHKVYWDTEERYHMSDGAVALGPLAIACMARDSGVPIEVESDYMPKHLLEGSWLNEFPT